MYHTNLCGSKGGFNIPPLRTGLNTSERQALYAKYNSSQIIITIIISYAHEDAKIELRSRYRKDIIPPCKMQYHLHNMIPPFTAILFRLMDMDVFITDSENKSRREKKKT